MGEEFAKAGEELPITPKGDNVLIQTRLTDLILLISNISRNKRKDAHDESVVMVLGISLEITCKDEITLCSSFCGCSGSEIVRSFLSIMMTESLQNTHG